VLDNSLVFLLFGRHLELTIALYPLRKLEVILIPLSGLL
jgi:hypothetical protein